MNTCSRLSTAQQGLSFARNLRPPRATCRSSCMSTMTLGPISTKFTPLYLNVYRRSKLHFEKLTKDYFCRLGQTMPERVRFFVWRRNGKAVAFGESLVHGDTMYAEYLGLEYGVALKLH